MSKYAVACARDKGIAWDYAVGMTIATLLLGFALWGCDTSQRQPGPYCCINSIYMTSANNGWAVGGQLGSGTSMAKIFHYTGGKWQPVDAPIEGLLQKVYMVSDNEGWASGWELLLHANPPQANNIILHYHDGIWEKQYSSPQIGSDLLTGIYMTSANEGWAVGGQLLLHYQKGKWMQVDKPDETRSVQAVYMNSPTDGWTVGRIVLHYDGSKWSLVPVSPAVKLMSVQMVSPNEGWAVDSNGGAIMHFSGNKWQRDYAIDGALYSLSMLSSSEGWAVGDNRAKLKDEQDNLAMFMRTDIPTPVYPQPYRSVILHYENGKWQEQDSPNVGQLNTVFMTSVNDGWAAAGDTLLHYQDGKWVEFK